MNILKNVKRYFGVSGTIFLIGAGIGFFAIYFDIKDWLIFQLLVAELVY